MTGQLLFSKSEPTEGLEERMRKVSLVVSLLGLGLMCYGFVQTLFSGTAFSLPGHAVLPLKNLLSLPTASLGLVSMSAGVILLAMLPAIRVVLALWLYVRSRDPLSSAVALVVLLELLASVRLGS
jgi:uncharacterized membrane protein